jgi:anti-sigma factor RsiW
MSTETIDEMTCQEFVELVTDLIEGQLAEALRLEADVHVGECEGCAAYLEQMRQTIAGLRALAESGDFPATRERAIEAFRELKRGA